MNARVRSAAERGSTESVSLRNETPRVYVFGPFRLDATRGSLTYGTEVVPLPERLLGLLLALIEANGCVVSRKSLATVLSPDEPVSEANLSQHVYMLRRILGERAKDHLYIMTAHNQGFRFASPVRVEPDSDA